MFYWNRGGTFVVLTDDEEMALVRQLADKTVDLLTYNASRETRRKYERRIYEHLRAMSERDPEGFRSKYVYRSLYGEEARKFFPLILDAYGRATRRATFGILGTAPVLDNIVDSVIHTNSKEVYHITLLSPAWWSPWRYRPSCRISFPAEEIEHVVGEVCNFLLVTKTFNVHFNRHYIRMTIQGCSLNLGTGS